MAKDDFLYQSLYKALKERIESGEFPVNGKFPSDLELKQEFSVSVITIKKALAMLAEEGLIRRVPGKGTFVLGVGAAPLPQNRTASGFLPQQPLIGILLEHVASPFGLSMLYKLDSLASEAGYGACFRFSYASREKETREINFLLSLGVKGLIVMPSHGSHYNPAILKLVLDGFPIVLVDKKLEGIDVSSVRTDNFAAMEQLVRHLAAIRCRSIGLVGIDEVDATSLKERRRGFYETVKALGLSVCEECRLPVYAENATDSGLKPEVIKHLTTYFTRNGEKLDAVICSEYGVVRETVHVLKKLGIRLHQDMQLCCIDEDYLAPGGFSFTHMKQDEEKIGEHAFVLLQKKMERQPLQGEDYLIPAIFRERQPL